MLKRLASVQDKNYDIWLKEYAIQVTYEKQSSSVFVTFLFEMSLSFNIF